MQSEVAFILVERVDLQLPSGKTITIMSLAEDDVKPRRRSLNSFRNAPLFWGGSIAACIGTILHFPMYIAARNMHFEVSKMRGPMTGDMVAMDIGMALIVLGLAASAVGLIPRRQPDADPPSGSRVISGETKFTRPVVILMVIVAVAVVIDATHPITLAFVAPGMAQEYGLKSAANPHGGLPVSLLPLSGITGTVIGSFVWGWFGDRIGRRASIILAGELFMTTAICGAMPTYEWNLSMCFMMGLGAGGMLPITFALIAETVPTRHRGWLMVLIGGEVSGAYALVSWQSAWLVPHYGWRMLWLIGMPTGALLIAISRWIPESPRFLLAYGRVAEAGAIMRHFGMKLVAPGEDKDTEPGLLPGRASFRQLWARGLATQSLTITLLGVGIGIVTYGFQLWIPSDLQQIGFSSGSAGALLRNSALIGWPFTFLIAWLYGFWSSKKTILILTLLTIASLAIFVIFGDAVTSNKTVFLLLLAVPILATGLVVAILGAYSSEVYPTLLRAQGGGLAAGAGKAGGVLVIAMVTAAITSPSMRATALIGVVPLLLALVAVAYYATETRKRKLEEISSSLMREPRQPAPLAAGASQPRPHRSDPSN